jgi:tetratricopeptide (TPR) repeat protein
MLSWNRISFASILFVGAVLVVPLQAQNSEQLQVGPPPLHRAEPPAPGATAEELESQGDLLRTDKNYLDAVDYYQAALIKGPATSNLLNKIGICQMMLQRLKESKKSLERAISADRNHSDAYNNLGVIYYQLGVFHRENGNFKKAIKMYDKAIALSSDSASYYNNRGAAYFARRQFEAATTDYATAMKLDPEIFERTSRAGVQAMLPSPEDRARYDYVLAKLYARSGIVDRSLHYLKKAMEDGYKEIANVYKDNEFAELRKDPRFTELMTAKTVSLPE